MLVLNKSDINDLHPYDQKRLFPMYYVITGLSGNGKNLKIEYKEFKKVGNRNIGRQGRKPRQMKAEKIKISELSKGVLDSNISRLEEILRSLSDTNPGWGVTAPRGNMKKYIPELVSALSERGVSGMLLVKKHLLNKEGA